MNKNKTTLRKIGLLGLLMSFAGITQAQYLDDGIRFSQSDIGATARFKAMGGAQTALGGDLSSIAGNPAGLGFYNNSDASFTLGFQNDLNKSTYFSTSTDRNKNKFDFDQAGVLIHMPVMKPYGQNMQSGWLNFNVGISYNKTQDFNTNIDFTGENNISSYTDMLADFSGETVYNAWGKGSYFVRNNGKYSYPTTSENFANSQNNKEYRSGNQYQTNIAFGANYSNQFYIGASVGIAGFHYESNRSFSELGVMKNASDFAKVDQNVDFLNPNSTAYKFLDEDYELLSSSFQATDGSGVNATLGMIFLPHKMWRIGLSATTPTWYKVREDFTMYLDSWMIDQTNANNELFSYSSPEENYYDEYDLRTPYKLNAGVAALFDGGLLSADIEYVDYASMRITQSNQTNAAKDEQIATIKDTYQGTINVRVGGEYVFSPQLLARAGYNYNGSPYKEYESTRQTVSAGLGYRINNVYVDLAYQNQLYKQEYVPYQSTVNPTEAALIENTRNNVMLTLGVKF